MIHLVIDATPEPGFPSPFQHDPKDPGSTALLSDLKRIKGYVLQNITLPQSHVQLSIPPLGTDEGQPTGDVFLLYFYGDHSWLYTPCQYTLSEDQAKVMVARRNEQSIPTTQFDHGYWVLRPYPAVPEKGK